MKHLKYAWYVIRHRWYVLVECLKMGLLWRGLVHDLSKFLPSEWFLFVGENPCGEKTSDVLQLIDIEVGRGMNGEVAIFGPKKTVVLVGCVFQSEVQDDTHTTIKLTAKEVRDA